MGMHTNMRMHMDKYMDMHMHMDQQKQLCGELAHTGELGKGETHTWERVYQGSCSVEERCVESDAEEDVRSYADGDVSRDTQM